MRPASAWWSITGGPTIAGSRGSIHTGDARKAIELRQFSFGNSPQMRDSSSVVIGNSDSHTAAWKASGTTSGEAASMARMRVGEPAQALRRRRRGGPRRQKVMEVERHRGLEQPRRVLLAREGAHALGVAQLGARRDEIEEQDEVGVRGTAVRGAEADVESARGQSGLVAERGLEQLHERGGHGVDRHQAALACWASRESASSFGRSP